MYAKRQKRKLPGTPADSDGEDNVASDVDEQPSPPKRRRKRKRLSEEALSPSQPFSHPCKQTYPPPPKTKVPLHIAIKTA
jgi:hypothetical protein